MVGCNFNHVFRKKFCHYCYEKKFQFLSLLIDILVCTKWIDRDNPSGAGDFETVPDQIPRSWINVIIQRCPNSYQILARHGRRMFTNPAQILLAYGLQTSFIYPSTGPALGTSGFACDWRNPTNKGKRRIDFSVRYCCGKLVKFTESMVLSNSIILSKYT